MKKIFALTVAAMAFAAVAPAHASLELAKKARCVSCHSVEKKRVGPAFRDIAARYKDQPGIEATLMHKVRTGGSGNWGDVPMMPHDPEQLADADLQSLVRWILDGAKTD